MVFALLVPTAVHGARAGWVAASEATERRDKIVGCKGGRNRWDTIAQPQRRRVTGSRRGARRDLSFEATQTQASRVSGSRGSRSVASTARGSRRGWIAKEDYLEGLDRWFAAVAIALLPPRGPRKTLLLSRLIGAAFRVLVLRCVGCRPVRPARGNDCRTRTRASTTFLHAASSKRRRTRWSSWVATGGSSSSTRRARSCSATRAET